MQKEKAVPHIILREVTGANSEHLQELNAGAIQCHSHFNALDVLDRNLAERRANLEALVNQLMEEEGHAAFLRKTLNDELKKIKRDAKVAKKNFAREQKEREKAFQESVTSLDAFVDKDLNRPLPTIDETDDSE